MIAAQDPLPDRVHVGIFVGGVTKGFPQGDAGVRVTSPIDSVT